MLALAKQICLAAALEIGVPGEWFEVKPNKPSPIFNPPPRMLFEVADESLERKGRLYALLKSDLPKHQRQRYQVYERQLLIRLTINELSEHALESKIKAFLLALPKDCADQENNLVKIAARQTIRGGYDPKLVEVFSRLEAVVHLTFSGVITRDKDVGMITKVDFTPEISRRGN